VKEVYRQYAVVKSVSLMRDPATHFARGLAFVEFHSPEYAQYALQRTNGMAIGGADMAVGGDNAVFVAFARMDVMQALLKKVPYVFSMRVIAPAWFIILLKILLFVTSAFRHISPVRRWR
jgi:RNA recognition motif-containing protein